MKLLKNLTVQVIIAIILGIIVGAIWPEFGASLKILADLFINPDYSPHNTKSH